MTLTDPATSALAGFDRPYVDLDEQRELPVPHRYIHGGFEGTDTRFSFYFPTEEQYQGRFFQHITPVPDSENLAQTATGREGKIDFAASSGAYFVETNGGGPNYPVPGNGVDPIISAYGANAAAAEFSRVKAAEIYGHHRPYGYAYGGSGGAFRTIGGAENTTGVWDGFVPYVVGSPLSIPNVFSIRMHAMRILEDKFDLIDDAYDAGGSGDPFPLLNDEEQAALIEVTRMGFPVRSWFAHRTMGAHAFGVLYSPLVMMDPDYFQRFWTDEGHLGSDPDSSIHAARLQWDATVAELILDESGEVAEHAGMPRGGVDQAFRGGERAGVRILGMRLTDDAAVDSLNADLVVTSGAAAGTHVALNDVTRDVATLDFPDLAEALKAVVPGDTVRIDNSNFLAAQTYHRHQIPSLDFPVWDQFKDQHGTPLYPQRPFLVGPIFAQGAAGIVQSGKFDGKMILVACLNDREAYPWQADWYARKVQEHRGDSFDETFRIWYVENGLHGDSGGREEHQTRSIPYIGALHEALRQLATWVETGREPAASTSYEVVDGQVEIPDGADERAGIQVVSTLTADGAARAEVGVGTDVTLRLVAKMPRHAGSIVGLEWDLDGDGEYDVAESLEPQAHLDVTRTARFDTPGTHFVTARTAGQGEGDPDATFARLENLARARIVVS